MRKTKTYSQDFKDKLVKEYLEVGSLTEVSARHGLAVNTLRSWVLKQDQNFINKQKEKKSLRDMEKELEKKDIEIRILKELLKKTNQVWLKD